MFRKAETTRFLSQRSIRFIVLGLLVVFLIACSSCQGIDVEKNSSKNIWVDTWGASPFTFQSFFNVPGPGPFMDQTVRQIVRISVGGDQLRVRFSNEMGDTPLAIGAASIAVVDKASSIKPDTLRKLTFGGLDAITIPAGAPALSDPVNLPVKALSELAVSIYLPEKTDAGRAYRTGPHSFHLKGISPFPRNCRALSSRQPRYSLPEFMPRLLKKPE